jgi:hypothetical protein
MVRGATRKIAQQLRIWSVSQICGSGGAKPKAHYISFEEEREEHRSG